MGFAFKSNTNDTRESPAIYICRKLLEEGAILNIFDPKVSKNQIDKDLKGCSDDLNIPNNQKNWFFSNSLYETFEDTDAAIFMTEWKEFENLEWNKISTSMRKPSWVFDTRSILKKDIVKQYGINIWQVGSVS